jgi:hypothetical protein
VLVGDQHRRRPRKLFQHGDEQSVEGLVVGQVERTTLAPSLDDSQMSLQRLEQFVELIVQCRLGTVGRTAHQRLADLSAYTGGKLDDEGADGRRRHQDRQDEVADAASLAGFVRSNAHLEHQHQCGRNVELCNPTAADGGVASAKSASNTGATTYERER